MPARLHVEIQIKEELPNSWTDWFARLSISRSNELTHLSGEMEDQSSLWGILERIHNLNLTLISVRVSDLENNQVSI